MIFEKNIKYLLPKVGYTRTFKALDISRTITNDSMGMIGYNGNYNPSTVLESPGSEVLVLVRPEDLACLYYISFYTRDVYKIKLTRHKKEDLFLFMKKEDLTSLIEINSY